MSKQKPSSAKALYRAAASARFLAEDLPHVDEIIRGVDDVGKVLDGVLGRLLDGGGKEGAEREVVERCGRTLDAVVGVVDLFLGEEGGY
ncbi:unnamed protein product [Tuber melanosporum]|uniref:(Perigord truffle) hypothetical protein n=1 Tax=Tuber melanosporum (strain Mel28) TaxID=656061 RepID=D5GEM1_TUBMM|nr:uncharacterized protein GSTUM_00006558001 [Tuber melanosporum]CAZ82964.1 unnamed protein product [Tuber melanosporum]